MLSFELEQGQTEICKPTARPGCFTVLVTEDRTGQGETVALRSGVLAKSLLLSSTASDPYTAPELSEQEG